MRLVNSGICKLTATLKTDSNVKISGLVKVTHSGAEIISLDEVRNIKTYKVTFLGKDNEVLKEETVFDGFSAFYPIPKVYPGYKFIGWDKEVYDIKEDTTIKALYEIGENNKYTGKKFAIIGDSISTYKTYIPTGYSYFYPYPLGDVYEWRAV